MSARRAIFVAPFDELADAAVVADLATRAEDRGWDGFFVWDHVAYRAPVRAIADTWVTLTAVALATERIILGPMVTPVARRRPHQLARETATLDRLSGGRLVLGVGLGSGTSTEFDADRFGEEPDPQERARLLDDGLDRLLAYWGGEFEPRPVQTPIPIWVASRWPNRRPLRRAARYDGLFPIEVPTPDDLAALVADLGQLRSGSPDPYEVVVTHPPGTDLGPWVDAGATWCLTGWGPQPELQDVIAAIDSELEVHPGR
jgi:alkanesulfonate monooxygenase SsuD/methylene tetrahydromethanopterin reductase-like flavin-dependent oxidoreductase (luciferase family)